MLEYERTKGPQTFCKNCVSGKNLVFKLRSKSSRPITRQVIETTISHKQDQVLSWIFACDETFMVATVVSVLEFYSKKYLCQSNCLILLHRTSFNLFFCKTIEHNNWNLLNKFWPPIDFGILCRCLLKWSLIVQQILVVMCVTVSKGFREFLWFYHVLCYTL